jgi:outer membrane protein W
VAGLWLAAPGSANAQQIRRVEPRQSIGFNLGYFALRSVDSREDGDVLLANLPSLVFEVDDFNFVTFGGEWTFALNDYLEGALGANYYQRTVPSVYWDVTHENDAEIAQDLKLRIVPLTATMKFLPLGRSAIQPYVGGGIGLFNWHYSEVGEFVDFSDNTIFQARYVSNGNAVGPVIMAGIRGAVDDVWLVGGEIRWQKATGDLDLSQGFVAGADKIDLGGWTTSFTVNLRF